MCNRLNSNCPHHLGDNDVCHQKITWNRAGEIELKPNIVSEEDCFLYCLDNLETTGCTGYTWYGELYKLENVCVTFSELKDEYECKHCASGKIEDGISCYCSQEGECEFINDNFLGDLKAESELQCFNLCLGISECKYYTWFNSENGQIHNQCLLFSTCETIKVWDRPFIRLHFI